MDLVPVRCRVPELTRKIGKTQQWVANQIGMSKQQLSDYVNLRYIPNIVILMKLAKLFGVHIEDLYVWDWREE
ncbi:helix-turn-helix transcriptional regulator [Paenibacillus tarimensis]